MPPWYAPLYLSILHHPNHEPWVMGETFSGVTLAAMLLLRDVVESQKLHYLEINSTRLIVMDTPRIEIRISSSFVLSDGLVDVERC